MKKGEKLPFYRNAKFVQVWGEESHNGVHKNKMDNEQNGFLSPKMLTKNIAGPMALGELKKYIFKPLKCTVRGTPKNHEKGHE